MRFCDATEKQRDGELSVGILQKGLEEPEMRMLVLILVISSTLFASAQTENTRRADPATPAPQASVEQLVWLVGHWSGRGFGDLSEETWAPPHDDSMIGLFRQHSKGAPLFYEILLIKETAEGSLELRLKHFTPELKGWEEKDDFVTFALVALEEQTAYFSGLTYRRTGDTLNIFLALKGDDGTVKEHNFVLERVSAEVAEDPAPEPE